MADDLKIQLESRQDLLYLRDELRKYLDENSFTTTKEQREGVVPVRPSIANLQFLEDIFSIIAPNVQVDGVDIDKLPTVAVGTGLFRWSRSICRRRNRSQP